MTEFFLQPEIRHCRMDSEPELGEKFGMSRKLSPPKKRGPYRKRRFVREFPSTPVGWPKVSEWRMHMDWTQEELAERSGLSVGTISSLEAQEVGFSQETLERLAKAFSCTVGTLFDIDPNQDPDWWKLWSEADASQREMVRAYTQGLLTRKQ